MAGKNFQNGRFPLIRRLRAKSNHAYKAVPGKPHTISRLPIQVACFLYYAQRPNNLLITPNRQLYGVAGAGLRLTATLGAVPGLRISRNMGSLIHPSM